MNDTLDPTIKNLASAIKKQETGGSKDPYNANGASGENGAYQFMPNTWKSWAGTHLGDPNAPMTMENQNKVAYNQIKSWKDKGYNPAQIAAAWNAGEGSVANDKWKEMKGVNKLGVAYDTPSYVKNVSQYYNDLKGSQVPQNTPSSMSADGIDLSPLGTTNFNQLRGEDIVNRQEHPIIGGAIDLVGGIPGAAMQGVAGNIGDVAAGVANQFRSTPELGVEGQRPVGYSQSGEQLTPGQTALQAVAKLGEAGLTIATLGEGAAVKQAAQKGLNPIINTVFKNALPSIAEKRLGTSLVGAGLMGSNYVANNAEQAPGELALNTAVESGKGALGGPLLDLLGSGAIRTASKFTGDRKIISDLAKAKDAGDTAKVEQLTNTPEYVKWQPEIEKQAKQERDRISNLIQDLDTTSNKAGEVKDSLRQNADNEGDTAIKIVQEQYKNSTKKGGSFDDINTRIKEERGVYAKQGNDIVEAVTTSHADPFRAEPASSFRADVISQLPATYQEVGGIAGNQPLREKALKFIEDAVSSNLDNGQLTFNKLDTWRQLGNRDFGGDIFTKEMSQALARASRSTVDKVTAKLETTGDQTLLGLLKQYNDLRKLQSATHLAEDVSGVLTRALRDNPNQVVSKGAGFLGTSAGDNVLTKTAGYMASKAGADTIQRGIARMTARGYMDGLGSNLEKSLSEKVGANSSKLIEELKSKGKVINDAKAAGVAKQNAVNKLMEALNPKMGEDIQMGPKAKSKFNKVDKSLPTIRLRGMSTPETLAALGGIGITGIEAYNQMKADSKYTADQPTPEEPFMKPIVNEQGIIDQKKGVIDGVDISKYATDPEHEVKVKNIHASLPPIATSTEAQNYIDDLKSRNGMKTKVTGDMIYNAAKEYGVSMKLMIALMQNDSMFGTTGLGAKTNNPGNIANDDAGHKQYYPTMREGVRAVARQLARYKAKQS